MTDYAEGGYMYCEGEWYDCIPEYDAAGWASKDFTGGTATFQLTDGCYTSLVGTPHVDEEPSSYNVMAICLIAAAFAAGLRQITKKRSEKEEQFHAPLTA